MKTVALLSLLCTAEAFNAPFAKLSSTKLSSSVTSEETAAPEPKLEPPKPSGDDIALDNLKAIATASNPVLNYYDPINLVGAKFLDTQSETIGWLRHAEIKHGRVAMAAFVGYCVQASGLNWGSGGPWPTVASPEAQWDALPNTLKWYVILAVGFAELIDEADSEGHYTLGGRDPGRIGLFQRNTKKSAEKLATGRAKELNNGRLAMIGTMGFVSEASVPGSVPILTGKIPAYEGNFWAPFQADYSFFDAMSGGGELVSSIDTSTETLSSATDIVSALL